MATNMLNTRTPAVDTTPRTAAYVEHNSERQLDLTLPCHAHARRLNPPLMRRLSPGRSERASSRGYLPSARTDIFYLCHYLSYREVSSAAQTCKGPDLVPTSWLGQPRFHAIPACAFFPQALRNVEAMVTRRCERVRLAGGLYI
jgi:hypothetical protein